MVFALNVKSFTKVRFNYILKGGDVDKIYSLNCVNLDLFTMCCFSFPRM